MGNVWIMNRILKCSGLSIVILAAVLGWAGQASAQSYVFINGGTTNIGGDLIIGDTTSGSSLVISNGTRVIDVNGVLGNNLTINNTALISGSGSVWTNSADLYIGGNNGLDGSSGNSLSIVNSGRVDCVAATLGFSYATALSNSVTVSGTGSVLNCSSYLVLGEGWYIGGTTNALYSAPGQRVTIANGGQINDTDGYIAGTNESFVVTGPGSVWSNSLTIYVGAFGSSCSLIITNGGVVKSSSGEVGVNVGFSQTNNNNSVLVAGAKSAWNVTGSLSIGNDWSYNTLIISNGGTVADFTGYIGYANGANNNAVLVTGTGSIWSNNGSLYVGYQGSSNTLTIANGGTVADFTGYIGYTNGANNNAVLVTGTGSIWSNNGSLYVGYQGSSNTLTIANGGKVANGTGYIGYTNGANNNAVLITDAGSIWSNNGSLYVGYQGFSNTLTIANGATVYNATGYIGYTNGANNNSVTVTGGSVWTNSGALYVGYKGSGNSLAVSAGGKVAYSQFYLGYNTNTCNNTLSISDATTTFGSLANDLAIGYQGATNHLIVANGATVLDANGYVGYTNSANGNTAQINGIWLNNANLYIGNLGTNNALTITGGQVVNNVGYIGRNGDNNHVTVSGGVWTNSGDLAVGYASGGNTLTISGGTVFNQNGLIGSNCNNNTATISAGTWNNANNLYVGGLGGALDSLTISGGAVNDQYALIGSNGNNNAATVNSGVWNTAHDLSVGYAGAYNQMIISGGTVSDINGIVGNNGNNNSVLVSGGLWNNSGLLTVGNGGNANQLTISGGMVTASNVVIGATASTGNQITVAGGSLIAANGSTGSLDVRNGTLTLNSGTIAVDSLYVTNVNGAVNFAGGTLSALLITNANGQAFVVGNGPTTATLLLGSGGLHQFTQGLTIGNNGVLVGTGHGITINGNYTQTSGGSLDLTIGGTHAGEYDLFNITGTASLAGTLGLTTANGFAPTNGETLVLLESSGARSGGFNNLVNQTLLYAFLTNIAPNQVSVTWTQISFLAMAQTPNQAAVGRTIDAAVKAGQLAITNVTTILYGLQANQNAAALNLLAPAELSSMSMVSMAALEGFGGQFMTRVSDLRAGSHGFEGRNMHFYPSSEAVGSHDTLPLVAEQASEPNWVNAMLSPALDNPWGVYLEGNATYLDVNSDGATGGYHLFGGGLAVGLDRRINEYLILGGTIGCTEDKASLSGNGHVDVDSGQGGLYAVWMDGGLHLEGMGVMGYNSYKTVRQGLGGDASGQTDGTVWSGLLSGGYDWHLNHWNLGPQALVQYSSMKINQYTEQGSAAPLIISAQTQNEMYSQLGAHISYYKLTDKAWEIIPNLSLAWRHDYQNGGIAIESAFANGAGGLFTVHGPTLGTDSAVVGAGVSIQWTDTVSTYMNYTTDFGRTGYMMQNLSLGVCYGF